MRILIRPSLEFLTSRFGSVPNALSLRCYWSRSELRWRRSISNKTFLNPPQFHNPFEIANLPHYSTFGEELSGKKSGQNPSVSSTKSLFASPEINMLLSPCEGIIQNWDFRIYCPGLIQSLTDNIVKRVKGYYDEAAKPDLLCYDALLKPLLNAHYYIACAGPSVTFARHVADSPELRKAAEEAAKRLDEVTVEMSMRKDIFDKLVKFKALEDDTTTTCTIGALDKEYKRCLDKFVQNGYRNGLHLSSEVQERLLEIKKRVSRLSIQFTSNCSEDKTKILFDLEELKGMSDDFIRELEKDATTGKYVVTLKYPHYFPITRKCTVPETRRIMETRNSSKCQKQNTRLLDEILKLRHEEATLLGYKNHASYIQDILMSKNPENVDRFLRDLGEKLQPLWKKELEEMLVLKEKDCKKHGYPYEAKMNIWDLRYFMRILEDEKYSVDQEKLMEYFPMAVVTKGLLAIYQELLSLIFTVMPDAEKWHDDVDVYSVRDANTSELLGYFFLDLYPRDGKYSHACCVSLQPGSLDYDGDKQVSCAAMLCNFSPPTANKPSLLDHKEVETYFHEFGHLMHYICSRAKTTLFFGTRVESDFIETPSQMLENWVWEKEPLKWMSGHYQTGMPLPNDMIEKLALSSKACAGAVNLRQIILALFDQEVHSVPSSNTEEAYARIMKEMMGLDAIENVNWASGFSHLVSGYSARYYGYLWSEVYSMDMFQSVFKKNGIFDKESGMKYRKLILEPGGSIDAVDMIQNFLGRPANDTAFLESKGLSSAN